MSSVYNRRRIFYIQTNDDNRRDKSEVNQKEVYELTVQKINEMLSNAKLLLFKAKSVKDEIEGSIQNQTTQSNFERMENYNTVQRQLMSTLIGNQTLDHSMTGAFVLRLCKELSYWRNSLPFLAMIIPEIDIIFQEQKQKGILNIDEIYISTFKKLGKKSSELVRSVYNEVNRKIQSKKIDLKKQEQVLQLSVIEEHRRQEDANQKLKAEMIARMKRMIYRCYRDNDVVSVEVLAEWRFQVTEDQNIDDFFKSQMIRNKAPRKQIKQFRRHYQRFTLRRNIMVHSATSTLSLSSKTASLRASTHYKQNLNSPDLSESSFKRDRSKLRLPVLTASNFQKKKPKSVSESNGKLKGLKPIKEKSKKKMGQIARVESLGVKNIKLKL